MTAVNAKDYYAAHADAEKDYVRIAVARAIKAGEMTFIKENGFIVSAPATENGYEVDSVLTFPPTFYTASNFNEKMRAADDLELATPKREMDTARVSIIKTVSQGEKIPAANDGFIDSDKRSAPHDGFLVKKEGQQEEFISRFSLTSMFNSVGQAFTTQDEKLVCEKDALPVKGILLMEDVVFDTPEGAPHTALAGSFLYPDPSAGGGYQVDTYEHPNVGLRLNRPRQDILDATAAATAADVRTAENQAYLRNKRPPFKLT